MATKKGPICVIVLGMAGSGKTSLVNRLSKSVKTPFIVNLDPACLQTPYDPDIDIRNSVNFKETMKTYKLGPNGAIVSCLNMFSTKFNEITKLIQDCPNEICIIDTPGQIEVFTWSISGHIITQTLAERFPTVILYVIDSVKCTSPTIFMSNMLYACSTMYKYLLPFIAVMSKTDIVSHSYVKEWMTDFDVFLQVLENESTFICNLNRRMAFTLSIFYEDLKFCGFSSTTGDGVEELYKLIDEAKEEYESTYVKHQKPLVNDDKTQTKTEPEMNDDVLVIKNLNELTDIHIRHPANESSSDSEGEEAPYDGESELTAETYAKHLEIQKQMQVRRAEEAQKRKGLQGST